MNLILQVNLIIVMVFVIMCSIGVKSTLDDLRLRVDHELEVSNEVAKYAIDAQLARLEADLSQKNIPISQWTSRFHLEDLKQLQHVDIELIASDGELLDSNHPLTSNLLTGLPLWLENSLKDYLGHTEIITTPIMFAKQNKQAQPSRRPFALLRLNQLLAVNKQLKLLKQRYLDTDQKIDVLNQQLITIQEAERKRLSAELHDEIGQHLTAIQFDLNTIKHSASLDEAKNSAAAIDSVHRRMTTIVRSMLQRLRPPELTALGIHGAISELFNDWVIRHPQHHAKLSIEGNFNELDETRQLTIYRIVQECLTNISRHAGAENVEVKVSLSCNNDLIDISVNDNGNGYHPNSSNKGYGLTGMRERVEALSGSFHITSAHGDGFTLSATFPTQGNAE